MGKVRRSVGGILYLPFRVGGGRVYKEGGMRYGSDLSPGVDPPCLDPVGEPSF